MSTNLLKPSKLVESSWGTMGYSRFTNAESEVLVAVYGPYESRNSQKADYKKSLIEVIVSDITVLSDQSETEKVLSQVFSTVIDVEKYPYLSIMICVQIFSKDENILSTCINAAYQAILQGKLLVKYPIIAKDFWVNESKLTLAIVPATDFILVSLCDRPIELKYLKECVAMLSKERV